MNEAARQHWNSWLAMHAASIGEVSIEIAR